MELRIRNIDEEMSFSLALMLQNDLAWHLAWNVHYICVHAGHVLKYTVLLFTANTCHYTVWRLITDDSSLLG